MNYLDIINNVDVVPYSHEKQHSNYISTTYAFLSHDGEIIGRIIPSTFKSLKTHEQFAGHYLKFTDKAVQLRPELDSFEKRNSAMKLLVDYLRANQVFKFLEGWRDELYVCFYPAKVAYFTVERSCAIFGMVLYGIHINGYVAPEDSEKGVMELWIARRSLSKQTWPGKLDNTIAGGLAYPYSAYETVVKESQEEAGIGGDYLENNITAVGCVSYMFASNRPRDGIYTTDHGEDYLITPELEYIYDLKFSSGAGIEPRINDSEVSGFTLMTVEQVVAALKAGEFKPNCSAVVVDFLIRKGYITAENCPDYSQLVQRLHRIMPYPTR